MLTPTFRPWAFVARPRHYLMAVAAVLATLALRYLLTPLLGTQGPFIVLTFAVVVAALYGGFGPAIFATLLGAAIGTYVFVVQGGGMAVLLEPQNIGRTVLFVCTGAAISALGGGLRAAQRALAATVEQLRASNHAKDRAMATLGHEIRNPLSVLNTAQAVLKLGAEDPKRVRWASDIIQRQIQLMERMANDLVDLAGVMRSEFRLDPKLLDLRQVVEQAIEQSAALMQKKGHRLATALSHGTVEVMGDDMRLVQVFANLLNNAAKYTDPGGELSIGIDRAGPHRLTVTIADNGTGMQPESIAGLFEPFARAPGAASNAEGGLGLGLSIVKKIVEAHGGTVEATSAGLGLGSRFTVSLPAAIRDAAGPA